jgi:dihydroxyacetone kinase-like predicted kinase
VDVVVSGGQTMNPSTQDLVDAIGRVSAEKVVVLPNNKNILMAANAAASVVGDNVAVVPTRSVPQAFAALLAYDGQDDLSQIVASMSEAACTVRTGEVTTAVKDAKGKTGDIAAGQVIGIIDDEEIEVVGTDVAQVAMELALVFAEEGAETVTLLAGADMSDEALAAISGRMQRELPDVAIETHRGEQPLYPLILSAE